MDTGTRTLCDFFDSRSAGTQEGENILNTEAIEKLRQTIGKTAGTVTWKPLLNSIVDHIDQLLDIDFASILLKGWKNFSELSKYADAERFPPDRTYLHPLLEHTITSKHKPEIIVELGSSLRTSIPFDITLQVQLKGFTLEILNGRIMKIHTGECRGKGSLKCLDVTLRERDLTPLALPGIIDLGDGIPVL